jgi:hypothetical protein
MYRVPAIATFLVAATFQPSLEAQMRTATRPNVPARMSVGPRVGVVRPAPGLGVLRGPLPRGEASLVGRVPFGHRLGSHTFFGKSWLGETGRTAFRRTGGIAF